jgi:hypothetical protein
MYGIESRSLSSKRQVGKTMDSSQVNSGYRTIAGFDVAERDEQRNCDPHCEDRTVEAPLNGVTFCLPAPIATGLVHRDG